MTQQATPAEQLRTENADLRARLEVAEETLRAIRTGEVDALIVETADGLQVFTLQGLDAESNRFRGAILAKVSDAVIAVDADQRVTYLNAAAERRYRVSASDVLGRQLSEIYTRQWPHAEAEAAMWAALREHGEWRGEIIHHTHDGREIAVEKSITALRDAFGAPAGFVAAVRDITEGKQSAAELQRVSTLLDTLLRTAPIGFCFLDRDLRCMRINDRLAEMNGISAEAHVGRHVSEILPTLVETLRDVTGRILATGEAVLNHEFSGETSSAPCVTRFWNESWYPVRDGAGEVVGFGGIVEEITERKQAEDALRYSEVRYRRLFEAAEDGVLILEGQTGQIADANPYILKALGLSHVEALGRELWEIGVFADAITSRAAVAELQERGYVRYDDLPLESKTGQRREVEVVANAYQEDGHRVIQCNIRDITERKQAAEALQESEARYRSLFENMLDGFAYCQMLFDEQGQPHDFVYLAVNDVFGELTGLENVIGKRATEVIPGISELHPEMFETYGRVASTGNPERFEIDFKPWGLRLSISVYCPMKGYFVAVFDDITERKQMEEVLRESERRFRIMADSLPLIIWVHDAQGALQFVNHTYCEFFGVTPQQVAGPNWQPLVHPDDVAAYAGEFSACVRGRRPFHAEVRVRRFDGEWRWLESRARPRFSASGEFLGMVGSSPDITEHKQAETKLRESDERMRLATEATAVGIWERNVRTGEICWDAQMFRIYGLAPTADGSVPYSDWSGAVLPEDLAENERILADTVRACGQSRREFRIRRRDDGEVRDIESVETVRTNEHGQAEWVLGTNLDITERKQGVAALKNAMQEAQRSARAKDDFLAALSHELRTPLTPVLMTSSALAGDPALPLEVREQLAMMHRNIELEARLIDDLLDLTTISRGKLNLAPVITDLHALLGLTNEIIRCDGLGKQVPIVLRLEATRHHARVDPTRIQQVFWNLLKNAVKFTPNGGSISVTTTDDADDRIVISVRDTGIGMSPETLPHIFNAFEQGAIAGQHRFGGLGLGLAISQAIISAHEGALRAESDGLNCGSTFTVELTTIAAPAASSSATEPSPVPPRPLKLLIVEDHQVTRQVMAQLLTHNGHQVTTAGSVQEALAIHGTQHFDAVISDLGLPDGSGLDLMRDLQRQRPVPGIALSGYGMEDDLRLTKEAGFFAHLVKPVNIDQLRQIIDKITPSSP